MNTFGVIFEKPKRGAFSPPKGGEPLEIGLGSRVIWTQHPKNYISCKIHAFVQNLHTFPHKAPDYAANCTLANAYRGKEVNMERAVNTEYAIMSNIQVQTGWGSLLY